MKATLCTANHRILVELAQDSNGLIFATNQKTGQVLFHLEPIATRISSSEESLAGIPAPAGRLNPRAPNWDWLPPATVIKYFKMSPVLNIYTGDVETALKSEIEAGPDSAGQLEADLLILKPYLPDLVVDGELVRGWQTRIAEYLDLPSTGGSFRKRIIAAGQSLLEFYFSTPQKSGGNVVENQNRRAVGQ